MDGSQNVNVSPPSFGGDSGVDPEDVAEWNISFQGIAHSIGRRRFLILAITLLGLAIGIVLALLPRHYSSTSRIQVRPGSANQFKLDTSDLLSMGDSSTKLESETAVLQGDTLVLEMADILHLQNDPDIMGRRLAGHSLEDPETRDRLLKKLHKAITITHIPRTEVINVSVVSKSPMLSARMVNTLISRYIDHLFQSRFSSTKRVADWLSGQLDDLRKKVENDQEQLVQLQDRLGVVGLDEKHDIAVTELEDLTKASDEARINRIIAEARYRILSSGDVNLLEGGQDILGRDLPSSSPLSLLSNLRNQRAQAQTRYAALVAQFGQKYPDVIDAKAEFDSLDKEVGREQERVLNQARQAFKAATANEASTTGVLSQKKNHALAQHNDLVKYDILLHDFQSSRALYEGLLQRLTQAGIVSGLESSEVDIFDVARIPSVPVELNRFATAAIGGILGLVISLIIAVVLGQFDNRLHSLSEIESDIHLPLLSITPSMVEVDKRDHSKYTSVVETFNKSPHSPLVESMWSLRTAIRLSNPGHPPKRIMLTSCNPAEGKSTLSCGLACTFSLRESRVLLIEGDMRRPTLARRFNLSNAVGLSSVLTGFATLQDAIQPVTDMPGLFLLSAGPHPPSPALILGSEAMQQLMHEVDSLYDVIIIDSPPALGLADSSLLAQFADTVILVLSYVRFNKAQVRRVKNLLSRSGSGVTGIALNFSALDTLDYYGYGYEYSQQSQEVAK